MAVPTKRSLAHRGRPTTRAFSVAAALLLLGVATPAVAQSARFQPADETEQAPAATLLTYADLMAWVDARSPLLRAQDARVDDAGWRRLEARMARLPQIDVRAGIAPAPRIDIRTNEDGLPILADDTRDELELLSDLISVATRVEANITVPLYTGGRLTIAAELAAIGIDTAEAERERVRLQQRFEAHRAYVATQWYQRIGRLLRDAEGKLDQATEELEIRLDDGDRTARNQLRQLTILRTTFVSLRVQATEVGELARYGLARSVNLPQDFRVERQNEDLPTDAAPSLDDALDAARRLRVDYRLLDAAVQAAALQERLRWREFVPEFGLTMSINWAYAPTITDLRGPFVNDPYNRFGVGLGLGMRWNLNPGLVVARARRAEAQSVQASAQREAAWLGMELQITEAWYEADGARQVFASYLAANRASEAWLNQTAFQYDQGLATFDDLKDPLVNYYQTRAGYLKAVLDYQLAIANLALQCGQEDLTRWPGMAALPTTVVDPVGE